MLKNKILLIGPIADFGGREVEVNIIAKALENDFGVSILSTGYMTADSFALKDLKNTNWFSVPKILVFKKPILFILSFLSKILNKGKLKSYAYLNNSISKKIFDLDHIYLNEIYKKIDDVNLVILCTQLTSKFLLEIVVFCEQRKIPCLIRTTGTIGIIPKKKFDFLKKVTLFIHHSEANAANLNNQIKLPYTIIDQCALNEDQLLEIELVNSKSLNFMTYCRLEKEKNIDLLINSFNSNKKRLDILGDGDEMQELIRIANYNPNIIFHGKVNNVDIHNYMKNTQCVIISYYEKETGPLTGIEALAAGRVIISPKTGAMPERLKNTKNQFWFENNLESLNSAIEKVFSLNHDEVLEISKENRENYIKNYNKFIISKKYVQVVKNILYADRPQPK